MATQLPIFPNATSLFVHSGNILNWDRLKKRPLQTPKDEFIECIKETVSAHIETTEQTALQYETELNCVHSEFKEVVPKEDRSELKLTVKIFLYHPQPPSVVREAVEKVLDELDVDYIETLLLSWNGEFDEEESEVELKLKHVKPFWEVVQQLYEEELLLMPGVSDLDNELLEELYKWATVKPCINQVNLASCCVMPPELIEFAKESEIQLLTHSDPKDLFPSKTLQEVISSCSTKYDGQNWTTEWAVCYSVVVKCRGIIQKKGNMVKARRPPRQALLENEAGCSDSH
ncbi:GCLM [Acanthosepion pharaonis]|uniref:GCS light chain n=1 Tax=Acanthosepion pharaonis TaxID=158019 RepID=A0A812E6K4_ACAPH|nr:GCLM [Sepia pharaonis]